MSAPARPAPHYTDIDAPSGPKASDGSDMTDAQDLPDTVLDEAMGAARRLLDKHKTPQVTKRPTIDELEKMLAQVDCPPININPDGSITVLDSDELTVARALLSLSSRNTEMEGALREIVASLEAFQEDTGTPDSHTALEIARRTLGKYHEQG